MARGARAACHGASMSAQYGVGVGSFFCAYHVRRCHSSGSVVGRLFQRSSGLSPVFQSWSVCHCVHGWLLSVKMYLWVGGLQAANGSGKRGLGAGGEPSGSQRTCARSYWQLNLTKPKAGRHGARGAGWQNKCPLPLPPSLSAALIAAPLLPREQRLFFAVHRDDGQMGWPRQSEAGHLFCQPAPRAPCLPACGWVGFSCT